MNETWKSEWKSTFIKLPYMYIGRKFKQDKMLKLNMQHTSILIGTSINFKNSELYSHKQNQT